MICCTSGALTQTCSLSSPASSSLRIPVSECTTAREGRTLAHWKLWWGHGGPPKAYHSLPFMLYSHNTTVFLVPSGGRSSILGEVNQFAQGHTTMNNKSGWKAHLSYYHAAQCTELHHCVSTSESPGLLQTLLQCSFWLQSSMLHWTYRANSQKTTLLLHVGLWSNVSQEDMIFVSWGTPETLWRHFFIINTTYQGRSDAILASLGTGQGCCWASHKAQGSTHPQQRSHSRMPALCRWQGRF